MHPRALVDHRSELGAWRRSPRGDRIAERFRGRCAWANGLGASVPEDGGAAGFVAAHVFAVLFEEGQLEAELHDRVGAEFELFADALVHVRIDAGVHGQALHGGRVVELGGADATLQVVVEGEIFFFGGGGFVFEKSYNF